MSRCGIGTRAYESNFGTRFSQIDEQFRFRIRRGAPDSDSAVRPSPLRMSTHFPDGKRSGQGLGGTPSPHQRGLRPLWTLPSGREPFAWLGPRCGIGAAPLLRRFEATAVPMRGEAWQNPSMNSGRAIWRGTTHRADPQFCTVHPCPGCHAPSRPVCRTPRSARTRRP